MKDPVLGGTAKIAEEMVKEVQASVERADRLASTGAGQRAVEFQAVLENQRTVEAQQVNATVNASMNVRPGYTNAPGTPAVPAIGQSMDNSRMSNAVQRIMEDVMQGQNKLDEIISLGLSGRNFSTPELLAMQAGVYRFTQELELTSKVVEKATGTIKQTMNTQV